jgi:hypothetical protein
MNEMTHDLPPVEPLPLTPIRRDGWSAERQRGFCEVLAECGLVDRAAAAVGMGRESAYKLRRRASGRAFALAWDAALLLARQRLIDDAFELAFEGSVERVIHNGKVVAEKRRRDPRMLLATIERLGSSVALGSAPAKAVAQEFDEFLDCLEADVTHHSGKSGRFLADLADVAGFPQRGQLGTSGRLLKSGMRRNEDSAPG